MNMRGLGLAMLIGLAAAMSSCAGKQTRLLKTQGVFDAVGLHVELIPIGGFPQFLCAADGFVWGVGGLPQFWRVDQATGEVMEIPINWPLRDEIADFAVGHGSVWISTFPPLGAGQRTQRFDPITGQLQGTIEFGGTLAVGEDAVWMFDHRTGVVRRIDPSTNALVRSIGCRPKPRRLLAVGGDLWMLGVEDGVVTHITGTTNRVEWEEPIGEPHDTSLFRFVIGGDTGFYSGLCVTESAVWATDHRSTSKLFALRQPEGTLARMTLEDRHAGSLQPVGRWPMSPVEFAGAIWFTVLNDRDRTCLARVDADANRVSEMIELPRPKMYFPTSCTSMVVGDDALWIGADGVLQKVSVMSTGY